MSIKNLHIAHGNDGIVRGLKLLSSVFGNKCIVRTSAVENKTVDSHMKCNLLSNLNDTIDSPHLLSIYNNH